MTAANYEESLEGSYSEPKQQDGADILDWGKILRTLQRRLPLVLIVTASTTIAASLYSRITPPSYTGGFQLQVEPATADADRFDNLETLFGDDRRRGFSTRDSRVDYDTLIAILRGPGILNSVIEDLQVEDKLPLEDIEGFVAGLELEQVDRSRIIQVTHTGDDPVVVQTILERLAKAYLNYSLKEVKTGGESAVEFIEARTTELEAEARQLREDREDLQQRFAFFDPDEESTALAQQMRDLTAQKSTVSQELSEQSQLVRGLQAQLGLTSTQAIDALALSEDQQYQGLTQSLFEVNQQIALEQARFKSDSPVVTSLVAQRNQLLPLLEERAVELLGQRAAGSNPSLLAIQDETRSNLAQSLIQATTQVELLASREQSLQASIDELEARIKTFPGVTRRFNDISDRLAFIRANLDSLAEQQQRFSVIAEENDFPWELVSPPFVGDPSSSSKKLLAVGLAGGFLLGAGLAILLDRQKNVSFDEADVAGISELLATIPDYEGERPLLAWMSQNPHTLERAKETDPNFFEFIEAFNSLYARLLLDTNDRVPLRSLGVSSAGGGDGKTTVAVYLAYAMASAGKNVLLVDANLRSPSLHERLGLQNEQGLKQLLDNPGQALKQKSLLQPLPASKNLRVLTAGGVAPNASQLLASEGMLTLMQKFRDKFDFVIYDCSRLQGYADAQYVADRTDGLIVVTQLQRSKRTDFQEALETLRSVRLNVIGTIANAALPKRHKEYTPASPASNYEGEPLLLETDDDPEDLSVDNNNLPSGLGEVEETFSEIRRRDRDESLS